jgi:hypothetical protein
VADASDRFRQHWADFIRAREAQDEDAALGALKSWIEAWDECFWQRDFSAFEAAYWPNVEIVNRTRVFGLRERNGIQGLRLLREQAPDFVSNFRLEITAMRQDRDQVVGLGRFRARARYTGLLLRVPVAVVWTLQESRISRIEAFTSHRRALSSATDSHADAP